MIVEICTDNLADTTRAVQLGANRIELCSDLLADGLTPTRELYDAVFAQFGARVAIFPMIRCTNAFVFSESEKTLMLKQAAAFASLGVPGLVVGALVDKEVDVEFLKKLHAIVVAVNPKIELTFHKAIDHVANIAASIQQIRPYCRRVLTSGGAKTALEGASSIRAINSHLIAVAAGNVRVHNVAEILARTGVTEIHSRDPEIAATVRKLL